MRYFPLTIALILGGGVAAGVTTGWRPALASVVVLSAAWAAATLAYLWRLPRLYLAGLALLVLSTGWLFGAHAIDEAMAPPLRTLLDRELGGYAIDSTEDTRPLEPIVIEGRLRDDASVEESGVTLRLDVSRVWQRSTPVAVTGGVSIGIGGGLHATHVAEWTAGRVIRAPVLLRRPARYDNDGLPDQERALARRGIALVGAIKSAALVGIVSRGTWWEEAAARVRHRVRAALGRRVASRDLRASGIAIAILIGDRAGLDEESERRLQEAGTYHVIAISGGNIAILAALCLGVLSCIGVRGRLAAAVTLAILAIYALVAGGGASVARASLTAGVYLSVRLIDQRMAAANAIAVTAAVLLLASPLAIADVGFWLTFGATVAILIGLTRCRLSRHRPLRAAAGVLAASIAVELALAPVSALVFQRVTVAGLLLNFAALPAMTLVQVAAMALVAGDVAGLDHLADWLAWPVVIGARVLTSTAEWVDFVPWVTWRVPAPSLGVLSAYYTTAVVALWAGAGGQPTDRTVSPRPARRWCRTRLKGGAILLWAALFVWIVTSPQTWLPLPNSSILALTMFDVGQGDAMLVTFPNGRTLVVDAGGAGTGFDIGDRVLGPTLRARGRRWLDYIAVTHGDPDHLGGARALIRDFRPQEIWWGVPVPGHAPTAAVRGQADRMTAAWRTLVRGDRLEIGGVGLRVHHPPLPDWERRRVRNDDSLVIELRHGAVSILLTGDIGRETEQELLSTLDLLPTVVLKVAHHGSATSSSPSFVETLRPAIALVGVGRSNPYGHPVPAVLERLRAVGTAVFRTDHEGQIEVRTDGRKVEVQTWRGRRFRR